VTPRRSRRWLPLLALLIGAAAPRSGFETMTPELQAMQRDDAGNPGMLSVLEGEAQFARDGCDNCHTGGALRGVAARYPAYDARRDGPVDLASRIAECREQRAGRSPLPLESQPMLALQSFVAHQSRGLPITPDPRLAEARAEGERLFRARRGQLNLSCAQCHESQAGGRLAGASIPEGHPNGYPLYRLEWQALGSLQRRLRGCFAGVRAEPFLPGSPAALALEAYLFGRAAGLPIETPAVRP
jgi:L-cysteine S-thiosulfotransferase